MTILLGLTVSIFTVLYQVWPPAVTAASQLPVGASGDVVKVKLYMPSKPLLLTCVAMTWPWGLLRVAVTGCPAGRTPSSSMEIKVK